MWEWELNGLGYGIFLGVVIIGVMIYTIIKLRKQVKQKKKSEDQKNSDKR